MKRKLTDKLRARHRRQNESVEKSSERKEKDKKRKYKKRVLSNLNVGNKKRARREEMTQTNLDCEWPKVTSDDIKLKLLTDFIEQTM